MNYIVTQLAGRSSRPLTFAGIPILLADQSMALQIVKRD
jgi:hypothetical protein